MSGADIGPPMHATGSCRELAIPPAAAMIEAQVIVRFSILLGFPSLHAGLKLTLPARPIILPRLYWVNSVCLTRAGSKTRLRAWVPGASLFMQVIDPDILADVCGLSLGLLV